MNRKERRAIEFGRAFSLTRGYYHLYHCDRPFVGIDAELYFAYAEENHNTLGWTDAQSINWMDSSVFPMRGW